MNQFFYLTEVKTLMPIKKCHVFLKHWRKQLPGPEPRRGGDAGEQLRRQERGEIMRPGGTVEFNVGLGKWREEAQKRETVKNSDSHGFHSRKTWNEAISA